LVECANKVAEQRGKAGAVIGYEEIAEAAFGRMGKAIISAIIYTELFGTCCVLFILEQVRACHLQVSLFDFMPSVCPLPCLFAALYKLVCCCHCCTLYFQAGAGICRTMYNQP